VLPIVWSRSALDDLKRISHHVAQHSELAAEALQARIKRSIVPAASYPHIFREGRTPGTREVVAHPNYIVVYRVLIDRIRVIAVVHSRQEYPPADEP
jgi:toxin ParE1/3/4